MLDATSNALEWNLSRPRSTVDDNSPPSLAVRCGTRWKDANGSTDGQMGNLPTNISSPLFRLVFLKLLRGEKQILSGWTDIDWFRDAVG